MTTLAERAVATASRVLAGTDLTRRGFLGRAALVGSALAIDPWGYVLKPRTAYASVCGSGNRCGDGWTAFCATITEGANTCPPGSYAAGWWKVDDSAFCNGDARYYIDCNRTPGASCDCHCSSDPCDGRRVCCNVFRYGQCNQQVPGVTEVVCRVILCTPPWEWDPTCTTTVRTDPHTASHSSPWLPGPNPTPIEVTYQDLGLAGSVLGRQATPEADAAGGGRVATFANGVILWREGLGAHAVSGRFADRYEELGREGSVLGYPVSSPQRLGDGDAAVASFEHGALWVGDGTPAFETTGGIHDRYLAEGGPTAWMGLPVTGVRTVPDGRQRSDFAGGWSIVHRPPDGGTRLLPADEPLPEDGSWPPRPVVNRLAGADRVATAVAVATALFPDGADTAFVARADGFADALTGGVAAGIADAPILLTATGALDRRTAGALERLAPRRIVVLGGELAVSAAVERDLRALRVGAVERWAGEDRFATAVEVSRRGVAPESARVVHVTRGDRFAEALAATPNAVAARAPILLVGEGHVPGSTRGEIARLAPQEIVFVGGPRIVPPAVVDELRPYAPEVRRVGSNDKYTTATTLSATTARVGGTVVIATGTDFPDGLAAGPLAARHEAPVLLVQGDRLPDRVHARLRELGPSVVYVAGGDRAVGASVARRLESYPVREA